MTAIEAPQPVVLGPQVWPLGVTSHDYDRSKLRAYASAGVKEGEGWLVLGSKKQIEIHRQPQGGQFAEHAVHGPGGTLTSAAVPGFMVELDRLFAA